MPSALTETMAHSLLKRMSLDPEAPDNWHLVTNTSSLGKVLKKGVAEQLWDDYLDPFQSSFRSEFEYETALVMTENNLVDSP